MCLVSPDDADGRDHMTGKTWRCRLGMHKWVMHHQEETGARYFECARCGKDRSPDGQLPPIGM